MREEGREKGVGGGRFEGGQGLLTLAFFGRALILGLRTLCLASRVLDESEYMQFVSAYHVASTTQINREESMEKVASSLEVNLTLLGVTAIEDKLQSGVPLAINMIREAGIKVWLLTGDKLETAVNIGFSSNLLSKSMDLFIIQGKSSLEVTNQLEKSFLRFKESFNEGGLVIDGESLRFALEVTSTRELFLKLGTFCKSVICCRVSPKQKAQVVRLVKRGLGKMCLAIGDGANDVSMIQEAHVGVGLTGEEGLQAAMASDYNIAQFRFLTKLLLVHGRWSYLRISEMILLFWYKNIAWVLAQFYFQIFSG